MFAQPGSLSANNLGITPEGNPVSETTTFIDSALLDDLTQKARALPRLRGHQNFHPSEDYACHRLAIAIEPGSYIPPHCHAASTKDETLLILRGRIGALIFAPSGHLLDARVLNPATGCFGLTIPHGTFHTLVALESSVFFEAKAGPYAAPVDDERPSWAPLEQTPEASTYLEQLRAHF